MILREMKKEEEKIGEKIVGTGVLVGKGEGKRKWWGKVIFSLDPPKHDLRKLERKCKRKQVMLLWDALDDILFFYVFMPISSTLTFFFFWLVF